MVGIASDETAEQRVAMCNVCDSYKDGVCSECGCVMVFKIKILTAACPKEKW